MKRAFTLVESLVCVAIISIVAAICYPVFANAKHSSQVTASISNLHQMHLAMKLYQFEYDGDGKYGSLTEMGLPDSEAFPYRLFGTPQNLWQSPCGLNPSWSPAPIVIQYDYYPNTGFDVWDTIAPVYQENLIMFSDLNCATHGEPLYSDYIPHRGLGVLLSGALLNLNKPGDSRTQAWWAGPAKS